MHVFICDGIYRWDSEGMRSNTGHKPELNSSRKTSTRTLTVQYVIISYCPCYVFFFLYFYFFFFPHVRMTKWNSTVFILEGGCEVGVYGADPIMKTLETCNVVHNNTNVQIYHYTGFQGFIVKQNPSHRCMEDRKSNILSELIMESSGEGDWC